MYRGCGGGWNTFWEPLSRHWERLRSSDVTPHMDVDLLDHVSFWNCPLPAISDYRFPSCMCKHLSLKNPEVQFKTKRESNECLSFWKNKLLNLRIRIRARLFWKKMPSSISGTPLNAEELSGTLRNALDLFRCCQHDASSLGRIEALQHYKNFGLLSQS